MLTLRRRLSALSAPALLLALALPAQQPSARPDGFFTASTDIGAPRPGATLYDPATASYRVTGGGADLWGASDHFHFTWILFAGDGSLAADIHFAPNPGDPTAKALLMFRGSLAPDAPYADVALHADGHITLQYRIIPGGKTADITATQHGSARLRVERRGNQFTISAGSADHLDPASPPVTVVLPDPVYVGMGVCAHNAANLETATFTNVLLQAGTISGPIP